MTSALGMAAAEQIALAPGAARLADLIELLLGGGRHAEAQAGPSHGAHDHQALGWTSTSFTKLLSILILSKGKLRR